MKSNEQILEFILYLVRPRRDAAYKIVDFILDTHDLSIYLISIAIIEQGKLDPIGRSDVGKNHTRFFVFDTFQENSIEHLIGILAESRRGIRAGWNLHGRRVVILPDLFERIGMDDYRKRMACALLISQFLAGACYLLRHGFFQFAALKDRFAKRPGGDTLLFVRTHHLKWQARESLQLCLDLSANDGGAASGRYPDLQDKTPFQFDFRSRGAKQSLRQFVTAFADLETAFKDPAPAPPFEELGKSPMLVKGFGGEPLGRTR